VGIELWDPPAHLDLTVAAMLGYCSAVSRSEAMVQSLVSALPTRRKEERTYQKNTAYEMELGKTREKREVAFFRKTFSRRRPAKDGIRSNSCQSKEKKELV